MMKTLLLTFDIEEFEVPLDYNLSISEDEQCKISYNGLIKVLKLLDKLDIKATLFITYIFAKHYPNLIKKMSLKHEIALHGYKHNDIYKNMSYDELYTKLKKAKLYIENIIEKPIVGFRSPKLQKFNYKILSDLGFKYDSSLNPTFIPGKYNNFFKKRKISEKDNIKIIPASVTPIIKFPLFWLTFHIIPLSLIKILTKLSLININFLCLYFHPWEFVNINIEPYNKNVSKLILKNTGDRLLNKLENYLNWCLKRDLKGETITEYIK